jgi:glycosyltransferase involved in cell wall biosynthesis
MRAAGAFPIRKPDMRRRVAFFEYFPTHYRLGLYEALARRMEVDFYFFADERERWHNRQVPVDRHGDYRRVELLRTRLGGQAVMPATPFALSGRRYDAVIKSTNGKLQLPLTWATARARGVPFVLWTGMWHHPTTPFHRRTRRVTEALYRDVDAIVAYGDHVKRFLTEVPGVDAGKVFVAGQAVDPSRFAGVEPSADGAAAEVLFIGQLKEYKGIRPLLDAWERLRADSGAPARLRMVGNGPLEAEIRARADAHDDIEILGYMPQEELPAQLARARCLVLPSVTTELDREPWGLVVNEAMHAGVPVVASAAVGAAAHGLVDDGRNGLVVPEHDSDSLAGALRRMVEDPDLAARMAVAARKDVAAFDYERMASGFESAVEHAVAQARD